MLASFYDCLCVVNSHSFFLSVQFSRSVMSDSLPPHESQHARPPCPSPSPRVHSYSRPLSRWCHPAIWSSVVRFSSCPQSLPTSDSSNESTLHIVSLEIVYFMTIFNGILPRVAILNWFFFSDHHIHIIWHFADVKFNVKLIVLSSYPVLFTRLLIRSLWSLLYNISKCRFTVIYLYEDRWYS